KKLKEVEREVRIQTEKLERYSYSTLVRPTDLSLISTLSKRRSGITPAGVLSAPTFPEIAPDFYDILNDVITC
ncbi:unnamed protein product, partial [Brassica oleracea]